MRRLLTGALAFLFGVLAARLIWVVIEPGGAVSQTAPIPRYETGLASSGAVIADTNLLTSQNPFDIAAGTGEIILEDAPETSLNLQLIGTRTSSDETAGSATILTPDNRASVYAPGEEVIQGVVLERVLADEQVLLRRNGVLESLKMREEEFSVITREGSSAAENETPRAHSAVTGRVEDGGALYRSLQIAPYFEGENVSGYRLTPRGDGQLMLAAGLQPGDVLVALDGDGIADIELEDFSDRLLNGSSVTLTVLREGKPEVVRVEFGN